MQFMTIAICLLTLLVGCESAPEQQTSPVVPAPVESSAPAPLPTTVGSGLFSQPEQPILLETPSEALSHWRTDASTKPALMLLSYDPLLKPIDVNLQQQARELTLTGSNEQLRQHGSINTAEPLILPTQAVTAALDAGLISKLYWVFPSKAQPEQLDIATFSKQMREQGFLSEAEIAAITLNNGIYTGQVRGIPFEAIHYRQIKKVTEPLILHIDTSFFRGLYDNEIKSPLYGLLLDTALSLRGLDVQPLATSLSWSTIEGSNALDVRFMISNLAELIRDPQLLAADMPQEWQLRSEALYAGDMYSESKKTELAGKLADIAPDSAAAHFDRFQVLFFSKQIQPALQALHQTVKLDSGYGAAYLYLAQMAAEENDFETALDLLNRAKLLFPHNPFITLEKAHILAFTKQTDAAQKLIAQLPPSWSSIYHPEIPAAIASLQKTLIEKNQAEEPQNAKE